MLDSSSVLFIFASVLFILAGIAEWLDHLTLVQRIPGSKPPSDLPQIVRK